MISPIIVITHAAFDEKRHASLQVLLSDLRLEAPQLPVFVQEDWHRKGSLWCWREGHTRALELYPSATHTIWLPDDAIICKDFGRIIAACIEARPSDVFDCFVNHEGAKDIHALWYTTVDGYTGMAGVMPRGLLEEHFAWRDAHPELGDYPNDAGVNLWAQTLRRPIYKTSFSLVQHDTRLPSLDGHDGQEKDGVERKGLYPIGDMRTGVTADIMNFLGRTYDAPEEHMPGWKTSSVHLGRTYAANHLALVTKLEPPMPETYWWAERGGLGVSKDLLVYIAIPNQGSIKADVTQAIVGEMTYLLANGIQSQLNIQVRDSLITRARDRLVASFLASQATHLLFWDSDIVPTETGFIKKLLDTHLPFVAGAAPFKNDTGHVVCVLDEAHLEATGQYAMPMSNGCVEVKCAGTGIMLLARSTLVRMVKAHMDKLYVSYVPGIVHRAEWALFQDRVRDRDRLSEDWELCQRWRDMGERVYVHPDLEFEHIGERAYTGSFKGQWGAGP